MLVEVVESLLSADPSKLMGDRRCHLHLPCGNEWERIIGRLDLMGAVAGPNAVLAFAREGYTKATVSLPDLMETVAYPGFQRMARRYWRTGLLEMQRSFSRRAFVRSLSRLIPEMTDEDVMPGPAGVRAQAVSPNGTLLDDTSMPQRRHYVVTGAVPDRQMLLFLVRRLGDIEQSDVDVTGVKLDPELRPNPWYRLAAGAKSRAHRRAS